mmetsp:Transcript_23799/g.66479  ORF Transcript_23799/g.66479 Transcript_23799/m.66479 type:complete len:255 (-) Transcript_23799:391-1155(-)|eukprot:CAMPEP_0198135418 /NCGR_PEP_ID=MMETSP1442-20131203/60580_1 /TAXON_ID= /ORGANISM="Craspedostauros australis, Strain CCMP3328" /LENGTH=254 /DNA_ID=CAMNT_0043796587 /DNA_START=672 /DNA_END=1436 /DNA_ORIENTATION=-
MAGDEGIELVGNDVEAQNPEKMGGDEEADEKKPEGMAFMTKAILLVGLVAAVVNAVAIVVEGSMIMIIAGGISIVVALAVMKFQLDLGDPDAMRQIQNQLRLAVNDFARTNVGLTNNIDKLEGEANRLKGVEEKLEDIAAQQGKTVSKLNSIVEENRIILEEKRELVKADVMQSMMSAVIECDRDQTGDFSNKEINRLVLRLNGLPAISFNEEKLREKILANRSLHSVIELLQDIEGGDDGVPEDQRIFTINED